MPPRVELLLFDLGGVLIDFSGPRELGRFLRTPATPEDILNRWTSCPHTDAFESGRLTAREWAERFVRDWDLTIEPDAFLREFRTFSRCVLPGARELLASLRPRYRLAALSNSNEIHWDRNTHELRIIELFEFAIASHEVGLCKPHRAIYDLAVARSGIPAEAIAFFDDRQENVDAAQSVGMRAFRTVGVEALRQCVTNSVF
jgi:HAD superfamily hydrolase (TIGR01509 family)